MKKLMFLFFITLFMTIGLLAQEKSEMDDDLDDLNRELKHESIPEEKNVWVILDKIHEQMTDAADGLSKASVWKSIKNQESVNLSMEEIIKRQKEALKKLDQSFKGVQGKQKNVIDDINKIIRLARKIQQQNQSQSQKSIQNQSQLKSQKNPKEKDQLDDPAQKPYESKDDPPPGVGRHTVGVTDRWGNLPPKIREAIMLSKKQEFTLEYHEWLQRYFKILSGGQK